MTINQRSRLIQSVLSQIKSNLDIPNPEWIQILQISKKNYESITKQNVDYPVSAIFHLCQHLNLNLEDIGFGTVDMATLREHHRGNLSYISPRYSFGAFRKRHIALNALNYIEKTRGSYLRRFIHRHFQIHESIWNESHKPINILFFNELWDLLERKGFETEEFVEIGKFSLNLLRASDTGRQIARFQKSKPLHEYIFKELYHQIEQNHVYKIIQLTDQVCVVECRSNQIAKEIFKVKAIGSPKGCLVNLGYMASFSGYIQLPFSTAREVTCEHRGDSQCRFEIEFPSTSSSIIPFRNRIPSRPNHTGLVTDCKVIPRIKTLT